jgi:hypothetical protein
MQTNRQRKRKHRQHCTEAVFSLSRKPARAYRLAFGAPFSACARMQE